MGGQDDAAHQFQGRRTSVSVFGISGEFDMDDPQEIKIVSTPEELLKLEQSDLCVTLYTIWDTLRDRGDIAGRHFFSCRNNSSVPDESFWMLVQKELSDCESVVDRGELFVLAPMAFAELRDSVAARLHTALESL